MCSFWHCSTFSTLYWFHSFLSEPQFPEAEASACIPSLQATPITCWGPIIVDCRWVCLSLLRERYFVFLGALGHEFRASLLLGSCSTTGASWIARIANVRQWCPAPHAFWPGRLEHQQLSYCWKMEPTRAAGISRAKCWLWDTKSSQV
jgi:hypothetical protein